jgi:predicted SAM-dependent methyltransferase
MLRKYRFKWQIRSRPLRIVIGASGIPQIGWIRSEVEYLDLLDAGQWRNYFEDSSIDALLAEHVWEHLTPEQGLAAAKRCYQYLRIGGYMRVAVPDGFHPDPEYIENVRPGGTGPGAADHKALYDHSTLSRLFESAGFEVQPLEYFDERGAFRCVDWLESEGRITRSSRFDPRNRDGTLRYTSVILDARKNELSANCKTSVSEGS